DKAGNHLWSYRNPHGVSIYNQGDVVLGNNGLFRGEKYPIDYPGFIGKDLTPYGIIENINSVSDNCIASLSNSDFENIKPFNVINPVKNKELKFNQIISCLKINLYDTSGKLVERFINFEGQILNTKLENGLYIAQFEFQDKIEIRKIIIQ